MEGKETAKEVDEWIFTSMHIYKLITTERKEVRGIHDHVNDISKKVIILVSVIMMIMMMMIMMMIMMTMVVMIV